jgi:hypothetical protein
MTGCYGHVQLTAAEMTAVEVRCVLCWPVGRCRTAKSGEWDCYDKSSRTVEIASDRARCVLCWPAVRGRTARNGEWDCIDKMLWTV